MGLLKESIVEKKHIYLVGIKGTGVCALAELLYAQGARISGSDTSDVFYTDAILQALGIPYYESFSAEHVPADAALVIYSAAYNSETNVELAEAARRKLPMLSYTEALGAYSACFDAAGIAGVHGKTTTTALAGSIAAAVGLPAQVLAGSAISSFGGRCTLNLGNDFFIAETCEYRRHFLAFHPRRILLTSVETDHQDYYPDYPSIRAAFIEYIALLPDNGSLIYCADDPGASEVAAPRALLSVQYGFTAAGSWRIEYAKTANERTVFKLAAFKKEFTLRIPGRHNVLNAAGAAALVHAMWFNGRTDISEAEQEAFAEKTAAALEAFCGSKRRAEILGEAQGILFIDDYGHHPTAIKATLRGLKEFYPKRRLVVSFMPHTYSRTAALLDEFAQAFNDADYVILHKIYASAREANSGGISGRTLFEKTQQYHTNVVYVEEPMDAAALFKTDTPSVFLTLGAGDNWKLGRKLYEQYLEQT